MSRPVDDSTKRQTFRTDLTAAGFRFHRTTNCWVKGRYHLSVHLLDTLTIGQFDQVLAAVRDDKPGVVLGLSFELPLRPLTDGERSLQDTDEDDDPEPPPYKDKE